MFLGLAIFYSESLTGTGVFAAKITIYRILHPRDVTGPVLTDSTYIPTPLYQIKAIQAYFQVFFLQDQLFHCSTMKRERFWPMFISQVRQFPRQVKQMKMFRLEHKL